MIHGVKVLGEIEEVFHVSKLLPEMAAFFCMNNERYDFVYV